MKVGDLIYASYEDLMAAFEDFHENIRKREQEESKKETYLTCPQVMNLLHVSQPTLSRWAKTGMLPQVKLGRKSMWRSSDISNFLDGKKGDVKR